MDPKEHKEYKFFRPYLEKIIENNSSESVLNYIDR